MVVLVQGPPGVGKSTLIKCMVKHFTQQNLAEVLGPITVVAGASSTGMPLRETSLRYVLRCSCCMVTSLSLTFPPNTAM